MEPRKMTSSFSNREKMRRPPLPPPDQSLAFVAPLVPLPVVCPGDNPGLTRRPHRSEPQQQRQLACLGALVGPTHPQRQRVALGSQALEPLTTLGRILGVTRRQRTHHHWSSRRGNQLNLGGPAPAGLAAGLSPVLFRAPVPSG